MQRDKGTQIVGDGEAATPMASSPLRSGPRRREPVIEIHRAFPPPPLGSEGAIEPEGESFSSLGSIAVRLIAEWSLPRMSLVPVREETKNRHQLPNDQWEED
jgi:hypothetical protein